MLWLLSMARLPSFPVLAADQLSACSMHEFEASSIYGPLKFGGRTAMRRRGNLFGGYKSDGVIFVLSHAHWHRQQVEPSHVVRFVILAVTSSCSYKDKTASSQWPVLTNTCQATTMAKILTVFGALGQQGSSIINTVLDDSRLSSSYTIRAVTRDPGSAEAKALAERVEVVKADASDRSSLSSTIWYAHCLCDDGPVLHSQWLRC